MRIFRTYRHVAQRRHWCDQCCRHIEPGEYYEGSVQLYKNHRLIVFKTHVEPSCDYPPDPDDEIEETSFEEISWKFAA
jgi:hypothetical protein